MSESQTPPHAIDPIQFGNVVQHQYLHVVNGRNPLTAARKVEAGWFRLDPINTVLDLSERDGQVFATALDKSVTVAEAAARESRSARRKELGGLATAMKIDSIQVGLTLTNADKKPLLEKSSDMLDDLRDQEKRISRDGGELLYSQIFDTVNVKALNIQAQAEIARSLPGGFAKSAGVLAQASLGGLIQECTGYLRTIGDRYNERRGRNADASLQGGRFTEMALFANRLLDWYDNGVLDGDSVRMTVDREDRPRLEKRRSKVNRRSFDLVTRSLVDPQDVTLIQAKSSANLGGTKYDPPIELWHPPQADIAANSDEIALAFETIVANESDADVRTARLQLTHFLG